MVRKGYKFRINRHLTWRYADGKTDKTIEGKIIDDNYAVVVRKKDCPVVRIEYNEYGEEIHYIKPDSIEHLPILYHSRTDFAIGPEKSHEYWDNCVYHPIYWIEDGNVYQGRMYHYNEVEE